MVISNPIDLGQARLDFRPMGSLENWGNAVRFWVLDTTRPLWGRVTLTQAHTLPLLTSWAPLPNSPPVHLLLSSLHSKAVKRRFLHKQVSELLPLSND